MSREKSRFRQEFRVGSEQLLRAPELAVARFVNFDEISDDLSIKAYLCFRLSPHLYPLMIQLEARQKVNCSPKR
jgi:hypothetical protein